MASWTERSSWDEERSRLNHHRLKNLFENRARAFGAFLEGGVGETVCASYYDALWVEWTELAEAVEELLRRYGREAGPARFFEQAPLCELPEETRRSLGRLSQAMWWNRVKGAGLRRSARRRLAAARTAGEQLDLLVRTRLAIEGGHLRPCREAADLAVAFCEAVHELGRALSAFRQESYVDS